MVTAYDARRPPRGRRPRLTMRCSSPGSSTPTSTSTSRAAPSGRASRGDPGGRGRRRDHAGRHAAQLRPADHHGGGAGGEARGRRRPVRVDVGFWGGAVPGNLADLAPCTTPECSASSASCSTPASLSSRTSTPDDVRGRDGRDRPARRADDRARRGRPLIDDAELDGGVRRLPRLPTARRRGGAIDAGRRRRHGPPAAARTSCTSPAPTRADAARAARPASTSRSRPARTT